MSEESDDKTEEPTSKKLSKAREEGNIAQTMEARILASMVAGLIIVGMLAPGMARDIKALLVPFIERPHAMATDLASLTSMAIDLLLGVSMAMAFPMAVVIGLAVALSIVQAQGILWLPKKLAPDFAKLSPWTGIKRLVSVNQLMEFIKSILKVIVLGGILFWVMWKHAPEMANLAVLELTAMLDYVADQVYQLAFITVIVVATITVGDYLFQRWRFMERMRMTKQEVKDEHKQQEGDPQVKARIRSLRMARARKRMMAAVPKAAVVITNPTHYAVALAYDQNSPGAPVLVAKGVDLVAKRIRELADQHDVPIVENPPVARALYATVDLDREIPPEHYKPVAEIIGYVMRLKGKFAR